jgi:hypothetical protein
MRDGCARVAVGRVITPRQEEECAQVVGRRGGDGYSRREEKYEGREVGVGVHLVGW